MKPKNMPANPSVCVTLLLVLLHHVSESEGKKVVAVNSSACSSQHSVKVDVPLVLLADPARDAIRDGCDISVSSSSGSLSVSLVNASSNYIIDDQVQVLIFPKGTGSHEEPLMTINKTELESLVLSPDGVDLHVTAIQVKFYSKNSRNWHLLIQISEVEGASLSDLIGVFTLALGATVVVVVLVLTCCLCCCSMDDTASRRRHQQKIIRQLRRAGYTVSRNSTASSERERLLPSDDRSPYRQYSSTSRSYGLYPNLDVVEADVNVLPQERQRRQLDLPPSYADVEHEKRRMTQAQTDRSQSQTFPQGNDGITQPAVSMRGRDIAQPMGQEYTTPPPAFGAVD